MMHIHTELYMLVFSIHYLTAIKQTAYDHIVVDYSTLYRNFFQELRGFRTSVTTQNFKTLYYMVQMFIRPQMLARHLVRVSVVGICMIKWRA